MSFVKVYVAIRSMSGGNASMLHQPWKMQSGGGGGGGGLKHISPNLKIGVVGGGGGGTPTHYFPKLKIVVAELA